MKKSPEILLEPVDSSVHVELASRLGIFWVNEASF